jgi:hypothetical protein
MVSGDGKTGGDPSIRSRSRSFDDRSRECCLQETPSQWCERGIESILPVVVILTAPPIKVRKCKGERRATEVMAAKRSPLYFLDKRSGLFFILGE